MTIWLKEKKQILTVTNQAVDIGTTDEELSNDEGNEGAGTNGDEDDEQGGGGEDGGEDTVEVGEPETGPSDEGEDE